MDYQPLKEAMAKVEQVVSEINEAKRQAEGLQRILDLQNMIEGVGDVCIFYFKNYLFLLVN